MSRKSFALAIIIIVALFGVLGVTGFVMARYEPPFYRRCQLPPRAERKQLGDKLASDLTNELANGIANEGDWQIHCTENEINAFLAEDMLKKNTASNPWPEWMSEPRVGLENGLIHFGFRYGVGGISTVVSMEIRPWLAAQDPNVLALEFVSLHAGAIPISKQWLLERLAEAGRPLKIDVNYYRYNGHPVLVLRFQSDHSNPTFQLREVKVMGPEDQVEPFLQISGGKPSS
jgi:hypothetical protein